MPPSSSTRLEPIAPSVRGWQARSTFSALEKVADTEHVVQFFETTPFVVTCISRFLRGPLRRGGGAIVIATAEHLAELERQLDLEELSVQVAGQRGQYICLDAEETLDAVLVDGLPEPRRFRELLGTHLAAIEARWSGVWVCDEMAGLAWRKGGREVAQLVQRGWRALARKHRFALLGAYPADGVADDRTASELVRMCSAQGRVLTPQRSRRVEWDRLLRRRWSAPPRLPTAEVPARSVRHRLPLEDGATDVTLAVAAAPEPGRRKVLIVDDNESVVETLATALRILGNEVRSASDGLDALAVGSDFQPEVILMDLGMPNMNGYDAARRIRQLPWGEDVRLVAITGWGLPEHRRRTSEAGFDEHLVKPVGVSQLRRLLEEPMLHE